MNKRRFQEITACYSALRIAVVGDYSCDRYLEIDPTKTETSIETGLPVHNVTNIRAQPGAAGTILNNLVALGIGELWPVGFCGEDGEGFELHRALENLPGVRMDHFIKSGEQRTFTYCKPLVMEPGQPPRELNRLDSKNWHPTPTTLQDQLADAIRGLSGNVDAFVVLDQVEEPETGVVTQSLLKVIGDVAGNTRIKNGPRGGGEFPTIIGDSRRGMKDWPCTDLKMNLAEFEKLAGKSMPTIEDIDLAVSDMAGHEIMNIFVTLAENGIICGDVCCGTFHQPALPVRGEIDIVGAGDAVTANLAAMAAASTEAEEMVVVANAAASVVIHKLGTTGTATVAEIEALL